MRVPVLTLPLLGDKFAKSGLQMRPFAVESGQPLLDCRDLIFGEGR